MIFSAADGVRGQIGDASLARRVKSHGARSVSDNLFEVGHGRSADSGVQVADEI